MKCPYCIADIPDEALACRHCGKDLYLIKQYKEEIDKLKSQLDTQAQSGLSKQQTENFDEVPGPNFKTKPITSKTQVSPEALSQLAKIPIYLFSVLTFFLEYFDYPLNRGWYFYFIPALFTGAMAVIINKTFNLFSLVLIGCLHPLLIVLGVILFIGYSPELFAIELFLEVLLMPAFFMLGGVFVLLGTKTPFAEYNFNYKFFANWVMSNQLFFQKFEKAVLFSIVVISFIFKLKSS